MKPIKIFWFVACLGHFREVVDEQLSLLRSSGLYDAAETIYICKAGDYRFRNLPPKYKQVYFSKINQYETPALHMVKEYTQPGDHILYMHTKGVSRTEEPHKTAGNHWRQYLGWGNIERWREHIAALSTYDVSGVQLTRLNAVFARRCGASPVYAGNYWWATGDYISKLTTPECSDNRWAAEGWIFGANPRAHEIHNLTNEEMITTSNCFYDPTYSPRWYRDDLPDVGKIGMTLLCRDEADIIKPWLDFHLPKVDYLIVTDNRSQDGTLEILQEYQKHNTKMRLIREPDVQYAQERWVDRMIAIAKYDGIDFVANSDADEFWEVEFEVVAERLLRNPFVGGYALSPRLYLPTTWDDSTIKDPTKRMKYYLTKGRTTKESELLRTWRKIFHRTAGYSNITTGNHIVWFADSKSTRELLPDDVGYLRHYPSRSMEHYCRKYINGGQAYEELFADAERRKRLHPQLGWHWREIYKQYQRLGIEYLQTKYRNEVLMSDIKSLRKDP